MFTKKRNKSGVFISTGTYVKCLTCKNDVYQTKSRKVKFCSVKCYGISNKGKPLSPEIYKRNSLLFKGRTSPWKGGKFTEEQKKKMSIYAKKNGFGKWMKGKHHTIKTREKISKIGKDRVLAGLHNNYKGGIERINSALKKSLQYKIWRTSVVRRDKHTCILCGITKVPLHADHIKPWAKFPELRFVLTNGRTLCIPCHRKTDTWGRKTT